MADNYFDQFDAEDEKPEVSENYFDQFDAKDTQPQGGTQAVQSQEQPDWTSGVGYVGAPGEALPAPVLERQQQRIDAEQAEIYHTGELQKDVGTAVATGLSYAPPILAARKLLPEDSKVRQIAEGTIEGGRGFAEGLASDENLGLLAATGGTGALPFVQKLIAGGFAAQMASHVPEEVESLIESPDIKTGATRATQLLGTLGFITAASAHATGLREAFNPIFEKSKPESPTPLADKSSEIATKEVENASEIPSTEGLDLFEQRVGVGAETPLRPTGTAPETSTPEAAREAPTAPDIVAEPEQVAPQLEVKREPETATEVADHPTVEVPLSEITLSKDVPQFKAGANEKGVVEPIAGQYERVGTAPVQIWERNDGSKELISGRHRLDLAQRTGEETIPSQIHKESEGFNATAAARLDAELNIRDNQGSTADYANYFKNSEVSPADAEARGLLARAKGKAGFAIARDGSEDVFALHQSGRLTDAQAERIASAAPGNPGAQQVGIKAALEGKSADFASNLIKAATSRTEGVAKTGDLFAFDDTAMQEMEAQAKRASEEQRGIREQISAVSGASKKPEVAAKLGVDVKDPNSVRQKVAELKGELARWENWPTQPDLVARTRGEPTPYTREAAQVRLTPASEIRKAVDSYDFKEQHSGASELADDLEQIKNLPKPLADALQKYRDAVEEDRTLYGERSGEPEIYGDRLYKLTTEYAAPETVPTAKLHPGETQGDMAFKDEPLKLVGEDDLTQATAPVESPEAVKAKAEAEKAQGDLFGQGQKLKLKVDRNEGGFIDPPTLREVADFGRRVYAKGMEYAKWTGEMIRHLGEKIQPHLAALWDSITGRNILPHARERGGIRIYRLNKMTPLNRATAERSAKLQRSTDDARRAQREFSRIEVPQAAGRNPKYKSLPEARRNAISVYAEAGGDVAELSRQEGLAKGKLFKQAVRDARTLTPEEKALASRMRSVLDTLGTRGKAYSVLGNLREKYVPHIWDLDKGPSRPGGGARSLQQTFRHSKARTFDTFFAGDQEGFTPKTLDVSRIIPAYLTEMNKVIADRQFVQDVTGKTTSDGRPTVVPRGNVATVEKENAEGRAYLVSPDAHRMLKDATTGHPIDTRDYKVMPDQPALHDWLWRGKDTEGNPIFLNSDLALHPEVYQRIKAMIGTSGLADVPGIKQFRTVGSAIKQEMFSFLAPFHQVQEGTHAVGHMVNPFFGLKSVDMRIPEVADAAKHGLMIQPEGPGYNAYLEGVGTKESLLTRGLRKTKVGAPLADLAEGYQDYLFHSYIPRLKYTTYEHVRERNMKRFAPEIARGEVTESDVKLLSAEQANAAYGHLNLSLLDRNPTLQDIYGLAGLAPDFLEARGKFFGQAVKGALGAKAGREQLRAIAVLAAAQAGMAYTLSQLLPNSSWDPKDPFVLKVGNRKYTMRSVPEDFFRLASETVQMARGRAQGSEFVSARINPLLQSAIQFVYGRNWRGEKTTAGQTAVELLGKFIPITLRQIPGLRYLTEPGRNDTVSPLERLAGSLGMKISRTSPIGDVYGLAHEWKKKQGLPDDVGTYPVSKYQQLRYALEDMDLDKARDEYTRLVADEIKQGKLPGKASKEIDDGFKQSISKPFTGSRDNDLKFSASLKGDDKALYDLAVTRRNSILQRFSQTLSVLETGGEASRGKRKTTR